MTERNTTHLAGEFLVAGELANPAVGKAYHTGCALCCRDDRRRLLYLGAGEFDVLPGWHV